MNEWLTTSTVLDGLCDFDDGAAWEPFAERFRRPIVSFAKGMGLSTAESWDAEWERTVLDRCIKQVHSEVTENTFRAFDLVVRKNKSADEAAEMLGMSRGAVYTAKHRVLKRVRELRPQFEDVKLRERCRPLLSRSPSDRSHAAYSAASVLPGGAACRVRCRTRSAIGIMCSTDGR